MHSINSIKKIQPGRTSYLNLSRTICFHEGKRVSGVDLFFPDGARCSGGDSLKRSRFKNEGGRENKRSEVFLGVQTRRRRRRVRRSAAAQGHGSSAESTALLSRGGAT